MLSPALFGASQSISPREKSKGMMNLLWHTNTADERLFPGWFWFYAELLSYIVQKDAWVAPVTEIG